MTHGHTTTAQGPAEHRHGAERPAGPSRPGVVVLDIGGTVGALVVHAPAALDGDEVEIRPVGTPWTGTHTAVRRRHRPDGTSSYAAVFFEVPEGRYEIRRRDDARTPAIAVEVTAATVCEARLGD